MENSFATLIKLRRLITKEREAYFQAIRNNKEFAEVKTIYLKIKQLEHRASLCMLDFVI